MFVGTNRGPGGTESHIVSMAKAMADAGHRVGAAVRRRDYIDKGLFADARIQRFPAKTFRGSWDIRAAASVAKACRNFRPQVIVGSFEREYLAAMLIARQMGALYTLFRHLDDRYLPTTRLAMRYADIVIVPSHFSRGRVIEIGVPAAAVFVLYNAVDTSRFRPDQYSRARARQDLGVSDDEVVVSFFGRFEAEKGVFILSRALELAMARCPLIRPLWVGQGKEIVNLKAIVESSPGASRPLWRPWTEDVSGLMCASDVVVLPSIVNETFGRVMIEAQACGVAVLGSDLGGIPETMRSGITGRLVPAGDVAAWADAIVALADSSATRRALGSAGRDFAATTFDPAVIARQFTDLLEGFSSAKGFSGGRHQC
ncbi:MAG TPA: glycosyltransferase family 4 protein [Gemmatimonadaceae bacterium]|nr:glycosyltransferase family 4 protein [Gemmatimonadaceae bacterium]